MPVIQQHSQETVHKMLVENANIQHPRRHHEFFLRSRPYKGEPPTVAGKSLLFLCSSIIFIVQTFGQMRVCDSVF